MFNDNKFKNIKDFSKYRDKLLISKKDDNSIIEGIKFEKLKIKKNTNSKINGVCFAIKDNFAIKNTITTSASKIIRNFKPNYTSTVFKKLIDNGAIPLFKANLDELAMGGTGLTSNYGPVYSPFNRKYLIGGSSSGSNYLVADKSVQFSIGSDTGDSVRKPAAWTGIVGFKPTWGIVSRYGMYDFAPSWDTVGWFTNNVKESAALLDVLIGFDKNDGSSLHPLDSNFLNDIKLNEKYIIAIIENIEDYIYNENIKKDYLKVIDLLKKDKHKFIKVYPNKKILDSILITYKVISSVEAFSCNSNLTGFHFGSYFDKGDNYDNLITKARTKGFDYEVKKRFLFSQEAIHSKDSYYLKALKMRRLIKEEIEKIFNISDALLIPSTYDLSPKVNDKSLINSSKNMLDSLLTAFNASGSPSISIPVTKNGNKSTSVNISSSEFNDKKTLKLANRIEEILNG